MAATHTSIRIHNINNEDLMDKIIDIFSHGKSIEELQAPAGTRPQFIILAGAPGVGKTTQAARILADMGYDYNQFYNVSLDGIVENVSLYRAATKQIYDALRAKRGNAPLTEDDIGILSEVYLGTIMSKEK